MIWGGYDLIWGGYALIGLIGYDFCIIINFDDKVCLIKEFNEFHSRTWSLQLENELISLNVPHLNFNLPFFFYVTKKYFGRVLIESDFTLRKLIGIIEDSDFVLENGCFFIIYVTENYEADNILK